MEHEHSPLAIERRLDGLPRVNYLRDWIYGGIDGAVTTFAIVAGVAGAELSTGVVLVLGAANIVADGFSMAASNYSGTWAEWEEVHRLRDVEARHIRLEPAGEREEIRQIYRKKGFDGELLEQVVDVLTADPERWIQTMLSEEYGLPAQIRSPFLAALSTFGAFLLSGLVPLVPYLVGSPHAFAVATIATGAVFFGIGSIKSRWSLRSWWRSGLETFFIGAGAAGIAYSIGWLLAGFVR